MNRHIRLVVSVLFAVIIILAAAITRFYFNVSKDAGGAGSTVEIVRKLSIDKSGNRIFEDGSGLYGIVDSSDRVIAAPEWLQLHFAGDGVCIAVKNISGRTLQGCIDYDGNISVPFIYKRITLRNIGGFEFYEAESDADGSIVLYSMDFTPLFMWSWDSLEVSGDELIIKKGDDILRFAAGENGLTCTSAVIRGSAAGSEYEISLESRLLLSKLDYNMLSTISDGIGAYLRYAFEDDPDDLYNMALLENISDFSGIFPGEKNLLLRRLNNIEKAYIYTEKAPDGEQLYSAAVTADVTIEYNDEDGVRRSLTGSYRASVRFAEHNGGLVPVSGDFSKERPDYPHKEETTEEED